MKTDVIISSGMSENKGKLSALKDKMRMFGEFLYSYVPIVLAAYFSSSLVLPGGMMPFGVALYAASGEGTSIKGTIIAISAVLGTLLLIIMCSINNRSIKLYFKRCKKRRRILLGSWCRTSVRG
jgi:hypothetical protein